MFGRRFQQLVNVTLVSRSGRLSGVGMPLRVIGHRHWSPLCAQQDPRQESLATARRRTIRGLWFAWFNEENGYSALQSVHIQGYSLSLLPAGRYTIEGPRAGSSRLAKRDLARL